MLGGLIQGGGIFAGEGNDQAVVSGGLIQGGNYNGEAGADTFTMTGGQISGSVLHGADNDVATVSGGTITGSYGGGDGDDNLTWSGGLIGSVDMGVGTDLATFINLTPTNLTSGVLVDGGTGSDHLVWDNTSGSVVARYVNWEMFDLTNGSQLTFSSTLTLGDAGTGTGTLSIDPTSTVFAGNGAHSIVPFTGGQLVTVNNAGAINLINGPAAATDTLTIVGNYVGQGGQLLLQTVLGTDGSPSDRLIISAGAASGQTAINVTNLGGPGDLTTGNGIQVVAATNGATTTTGAFSLGGPVGAGIFEYLLFRGGVTPSPETDNDWFLRSLSPPPPSRASPRRRRRHTAAITAAVAAAITAAIAAAITTITPARTDAHHPAGDSGLFDRARDSPGGGNCSAWHIPSAARRSVAADRKWHHCCICDGGAAGRPDTVRPQRPAAGCLGPPLRRLPRAAVVPDDQRT